MALFSTGPSVSLKGTLGNSAGYTGHIPLFNGLGERYHGGFSYMTWYTSKTFRRLELGNSYIFFDPMVGYPYVGIIAPYIEYGSTSNGNLISTKTISHSNYTITIEWNYTYASGESWYFFGWYTDPDGAGTFISGDPVYSVTSVVADTPFWAYAEGFSEIACPIEGTLITLADGTTTPIENLQIGDEVISVNIQGIPDSTNLSSTTELYNWNDTTLQLTPSVSTVYDISESTINKVVNINNGQFITSTSHTHIVKKQLRDGTTAWTCRGAFNLAVGDILLGNGGTEIEITSVQKQEGQFKVYKLNVEGDDTYIANGIITHNFK